MTTIVGLGGGIGASRLWRALLDQVDPKDVTLVVNTGDDLWIHGLRVCPDIDTTLYALSGRQDLERGWGVRAETWNCKEALADLGGEVWFGLGDRDLATHLRRTGLLSAGVGLAEVTDTLARAMGIECRVLPMTEHEVTTRVGTVDGRDIHYQEYLVQGHAHDAVASVRYQGAEDAVLAPGVADAIAQADVVILAPSNPIASIEPILAVGGMREILRDVADKTIAISPIVSGVAITDAAEAARALSRRSLLEATGNCATASGVAALYRGLCSRFVVDSTDAHEASAIRATGVDVTAVDTLLHQGASASRLLEKVLDGTSLQSMR